MMANGQNVSLWMDTASKKSYPKLERHISVDAAVIGGGIAGMTIAHLLKKQGFSTCVLEAR